MIKNVPQIYAVASSLPSFLSKKPAKNEKIQGLEDFFTSIYMFIFAPNVVNENLENRMKRFLLLFSCAALLILMGISTTSCNRGYGCPAVDTQVKTNRKGKLPTKGGSSSLFPKKMRRN